MESLTLTLFMSIVHGLSETDSLYLNYTDGIYSFLFWQISTRYRSCIFHTRIFSAPLLTSISRLCREYLIPTDNIIVIDHFFNLTNKSNLFGRL